tara:strand:- start:1900 stop:2859 length:960 start_codon:yes stop_codon:yes gene_type:complete
MSNNYRSKRGTCVLTASFKIGNRDIGRVLGYYYWSKQVNYSVKKYPIYYAGTITIGQVVHHLGVCAWRDEVFLSRFGEVWKLDGVVLPDPKKISNPSKMSPNARKAWADGIARVVADATTPDNELLLINEAVRKYHALVSALVNERCIKAASYGRRRAPKDYAKGISRDWTQSDLLKPREPTLMHALMVSLVLALSANKAADLIKLGSWLEYRVPLFSSESSLALYHNACWQLSRLCPTWHAESFLCDFTLLGSLEELFYRQFMRVMGVAEARELPVIDVAGVSPGFGINEPKWRTDSNENAHWAVEFEEMAQLDPKEE